VKLGQRAALTGEIAGAAWQKQSGYAVLAGWSATVLRPYKVE